MKKPSVFSFLISLLLFTAVCAQVIPVRDTEGNPVKPGEKYFIQAVKTASNNGGGLVPGGINILRFCPLGITLLPDEPGVPVSFRFPYFTPPETIVDTYTPLNIKFESDIWPVCNEFSKFWEVDVSSRAAKEPAILIGGKPGANNSEFTIETAGEGAGANTYKLANSYPLNTSSTGTVGTTSPGASSAPQLVITNDDSKTLLVKFYKYHVPTTATTSTSRVEKLGLRMFPFY